MSLPDGGTCWLRLGTAAYFVTARFVVEMTAGSAARLASETSAIARSEGLIGHAAAMDARKERE